MTIDRPTVVCGNSNIRERKGVDPPSLTNGEDGWLIDFPRTKGICFRK